jgi:hypothetical protein
VGWRSCCKRGVNAVQFTRAGERGVDLICKNVIHFWLRMYGLHFRPPDPVLS